MIDKIYVNGYEIWNDGGSSSSCGTSHALFSPAHPDIPNIAPAATWLCVYCGKVNSADALVCGQGEWDGCGGARPKLPSIATVQRHKSSHVGDH